MARSTRFTSVLRLAAVSLSLALWSSLSATEAEAAWRVSSLVKGGQREILHAEFVDSQEPRKPETIRSLPFSLPEGAPPSKEIYEETLYSARAFRSLLDGPLGPQLKARMRAAKAREGRETWNGSETRNLVEQGPPSNRINLTIVGDGYTVDEKEKFFDDARRITSDLFQGDTFRSYLPLFNVYAVFVPSKESGISDLVRKSTALGLYREPAGSKRAIQVGNPMAAERALRLAPATDYPILLANDDFYGGLGGRYAITTRSLESGTMVLRHELGHNFGNVGEEYDGGYVYSGANSSSRKGVEWSHWAVDGKVPVHESHFLSGDYVWQDLGRRPYRSTFDFPESGWIFGMMVSAVGWSSPNDVAVMIDGKKIELKGKFQSDRSFFEPSDDHLSLSAGRHTLEAVEQVKDGDNVLAFIQAHAYPPGYDFDSSHVGAYTTFDDGGRMAGYRPTHAGCLMREMRSTKFCSVDQENMWIRFLKKAKLIDGVETGDKVVLRTPELTGLEISWFRRADQGDLEEIAELRGQRTWVPDERTKAGRYLVRVKFSTPEVRKSTKELSAEMAFDL